MFYFETWNFPADLNMAIDVTIGKLSRRINIPIFRIYTWEKPTLSLGRHQKLEDFDMKVLKEFDIDCVRRPTGGRAVLHFEEITYSVVFPYGTNEYKMGVMKLYKKISELFVEAFKSLKYDVEFSTGKGSLKNPSCFSSSARYELTLDGKKFLGSAQARFKSFVLQHGSILLRRRKEILEKVFGNKVGLETFTSLYEHKFISVRDLVESIKKVFDSCYNLSLLPKDLLAYILSESEMSRRKYSCQNFML